VKTDGRALVVAVAQSFGNCPQYIHIRNIRAAAPLDLPAERLDGLDAAARAAITGADTLFVTSSDAAGAVDASHRGGRPGFLRVDGDVVTVPDFAGNRYFNTLGNLLVAPRAGLLVPDFETGDVLQLQGAVEIVWDVPEAERLMGAERLWRVKVVQAWRRRGALPFRWELQRLSPGVARTGVWT